MSTSQVMNLCLHIPKIAELFFMANKVPEGKKVPVFMIELGSKTYSVLRTLVAPTIPQDKFFEDLVSIFKRHFDPLPLVFAERF